MSVIHAFVFWNGGIVKRLLIALSAPIWVTGFIALVLLRLVFAALCMVLVQPVYWVCTGDSFIDDYHIL